MRISSYIISIIYMLSLSFSSTVLASNAQGIFTVVKGSITIIRAGKSKQRKVRVGTKVRAQDTIIADKDSRAKIIMKDKNVLNISPESKIVIERYDVGENRNAILNVVYGKVRSTVKQKYDGDKNKFRVKTPTAVAGVRGTDFFVGFKPKGKVSRVITFEGKVTVGSGIAKNGKILNPVSVRPGQTTIASANKPPAPPAPMSKTELAKIDASSNADIPDSNDQRTPSNNNNSDDGNNDEGSDTQQPDGQSPDGQNPEGQTPDDQNPDSQRDPQSTSENNDQAPPPADGTAPPPPLPTDTTSFEPAPGTETDSFDSPPPPPPTIGGAIGETDSGYLPPPPPPDGVKGARLKVIIQK